MNITTFINKLKELDIILTDKQLEQLNIYANFLIEYNTHTNLTAITNPEDIYLKHFYDSLTITKQQEVDFNENISIIDVGTGAGFPGMILKIVFPNIQLTLLDSNNKKITFLQELSNKLNIDDIIFVNERSEKYALKHLEYYDVVTSRAVANLRVLTEICLPMVKENGYFIPLKGNINEELPEAEKVINVLNGRVNNIISFELPIENSIRNIITIKKVGKTPSGYPRQYNKIKKGF